MSNDELILRWDKLYSQKESITASAIKEFSASVNESFRNGSISNQEVMKFAVLTCYLEV